MNYNEGQVAIKREPGIDWLKGLAIICVVLGHAIEGAPMYQKTEWLQVLKSAIYTFHMPLFFFLSGCTFAVSAHRNTFRKKSEEICNLLVL